MILFLKKSGCQPVLRGKQVKSLLYFFFESLMYVFMLLYHFDLCNFFNLLLIKKNDEIILNNTEDLILGTMQKKNFLYFLFFFN